LAASDAALRECDAPSVKPEIIIASINRRPATVMTRRVVRRPTSRPDLAFLGDDMSFILSHSSNIGADSIGRD
jgi:hypothetical protein